MRKLVLILAAFCGFATTAPASPYLERLLTVGGWGLVQYCDIYRVPAVAAGAPTPLPKLETDVVLQFGPHAHFNIATIDKPLNKTAVRSGALGLVVLLVVGTGLAFRKKGDSG